MRRLPKPDDPRGLLYELCGYLAVICLLVGLGMAALAEFNTPAEKIGATSAARATTGVAAADPAPDADISAAKNRTPTWIAATPRYNYTPPSPAQQAKKQAAKQAPAATAAAKKPKRRQAPDVAEASQAYGYAGQPLQSAVFQSPLYRDVR